MITGDSRTGFPFLLHTVDPTEPKWTRVFLPTIEDDEVIRLMIGRSLSAIFPSKPTESQKQTPAIEIQNLKSDSGLSGVNLTLYRQEVLGTL